MLSKRKSSSSTDDHEIPLKVVKLNSNKVSSKIMSEFIVSIKKNSQKTTDNVAETSEKSFLEGIRESLKFSIAQVNRIHHRGQSWRSQIIDTYKLYVESQHEFKSDYIFCGRCIECVAKVYALRVDSLHSETKKLCVSLGKGDRTKIDLMKFF